MISGCNTRTRSIHERGSIVLTFFAVSTIGGELVILAAFCGVAKDFCHYGPPRPSFPLEEVSVLESFSKKSERFRFFLDNEEPVS